MSIPHLLWFCKAKRKEAAKAASFLRLWGFVNTGDLPSAVLYFQHPIGGDVPVARDGFTLGIFAFLRNANPHGAAGTTEMG